MCPIETARTDTAVRCRQPKEKILLNVLAFQAF